MAKDLKKSSTWNIDLAHSGVHFSIRHMMFAKVRGRFAAFTGRLTLEGDDLERAQVEAAIDVASIDTGVNDRDNHLRSGDFFDVEKFPQMTFQSRRVEKLDEKGGEARYRIIGDLTIKDVTREVVLDAAYAGQAKDPWGNQRVAFTASTSLDRKDYGLTWNQLLEAGGALVGDKVDIEIEVQAVEQAAAAEVHAA